VGPLTKAVLLSVVLGVLGFAIFTAFMAESWIIGAVLSVVFVATLVVYATGRLVPAKFLFPGLVFLIIFSVVPIIYTQYMSAFNYKSGNLITREEAIDQLERVGFRQDPLSTTFSFTLGSLNGETAALLQSDLDSSAQIAFIYSENPVDLGLTADPVAAAQAKGFNPVSSAELGQIGEGLLDYQFQLGEGWVAIPQSFRSAARLTQQYFYDPKTDTISDRINDETYVDNGNGNFALTQNPDRVLFPGWRQFNGFENYLSLVTKPEISGPFFNVFIWTISFSFLTIISMFAAGLALAVALDKKIRFRSLYRSLLILPYAMPSLMSILIWAGMFNREFGAVNKLFGTELFWLGDPFLAKLVILIVNLWLGFPYFYLISTGALQALPSELEEAAAIDGASPTQTFFQIKFPMLFQILSPLIIASFAFNFNNFNLIYLLTGGGPTEVLAGERAGATDILITYTYKTAFLGTEQNLGLASAISVIMFVIVGALSVWSLRRTKVLEAVQ
jgi:arabinogalactan oligomer / maltooligosaccharide transport system permease protein